MRPKQNEQEFPCDILNIVISLKAQKTKGPFDNIITSFNDAYLLNANHVKVQWMMLMHVLSF